MPDLSLERALRAEGYVRTAGVDEAGRGPLAGPVYAAAVILPEGFGSAGGSGIDDSKKLSPKRRDALAEIIKASAVWAVGTASEAEIDALNILNASMLAMRRAVEGLAERADFLLVDGLYTRGLPEPARAVVHGDALSLSIAAASIIAKTERDRHMVMLDEKYPGYGFAKHKGYPTKAHYAALRELGPSPVHRVTFLKNA